MELGQNFARVIIDQSGATTTALRAGASGKINRLHSLLVVNSGSSGTVQIKSGATALTGAMPVANDGQIQISFVPQVEGCLTTSSGGALNLTTVTAVAEGYAVTSQSSA